MRQIALKNTDLLVFDTMTEFIDTAINVSRPVRGKPWDHLTPGKYRFEDKWIGRPIKDYDEFPRIAFEPWDEGMQTYERMLDTLQDYKLQPPRSLKRKAAWSEDSGNELCLDRLRYQLPFWRTTQRSHRPGPVNVTIVSDVSASVSVEAKDVLWRGAATVCLTKILEESGYRIELWSARRVTSPWHRNNRYFAVGCCLKRPQDWLDEVSIVNAGSSWMLRCIHFAIGNVIEEPTQGQGGSTNIDIILPEITPDEQVIACKEVWSEQTAVQWVKEQLAKFETGAFQQRS